MFFNFAQKGNKAELKGKKKIKDKDVFEIVATTKDGTAVTYWIDPTTYYITGSETKADMMGQEMTMTTTFSDYKKTDAGYVLPYTTEMDFGQFAMTSKVKTVEVNKEIDAAIFNKPK